MRAEGRKRPLLRTTPAGPGALVGGRAFPLALAGALALACTPEATVGITDAPPVTVALYQPYEVEIAGPADTAQPFAEFAQVTFRRASLSVTVEAFYDGDATWRARFTPEEPGDYDYSWSFHGVEGSGRLRVTHTPAMTLPRGFDNEPEPHRGHVRRVLGNPEQLSHADGTPHYWAGGKWLSAKNYGPETKNGENNDHEEDGSLHDAYYTDEEITAFLDDLAARGMNGVLLKVGLYPLEDDGMTWDLDWIRRADHWVSLMRERGIYCQINLFDPWSRRVGSPFGFVLNSSQHVLDAWAPGQFAEKENYIRYLVARFSGYDNVYWELGNRVRQPGFDADGFVAEANAHYVPWLRKYDPYDTVIELSDVEQARAVSGIDVEVPRSNTDVAGPPDAVRPRIVNELVHYCHADGTGTRAYLDSTIRDGKYRYCYRKASWIALTGGAFGSPAASWLDLTRPSNAAVYDVLSDIGHMKHIIDTLPVRYDALVPEGSYLVQAEGHRGTRARDGQLYVSYFEGPLPEGTIYVNLPGASYTARWLDPTTETVLLEQTFVAPRERPRTGFPVSRPPISKDAALIIVGPLSQDPR